MSRKDRLKRNLGESTAADDPRFAEPYFDGPIQAGNRTSIVLPERLIRQVLVDEVDRLANDQAELERFFGHFFDPTSSVKERDSYVSNFMKNPPKTVIGYPRSLGDWPVFAITLTSDDEDEGDALIGNYVGETLPDEKAPGGEDQYYEGGFFDQVNSILVMAPHPDQTLYLYHFAKMALFGAREALHNAGLISPHYGGGELNPQEIYIPDNVFARVITVSFKTMVTVPKLFAHRDGRRLQLTGIFRSDVVVDGIRGGVKTYTIGEDEDG